MIKDYEIAFVEPKQIIAGLEEFNILEGEVKPLEKIVFNENTRLIAYLGFFMNKANQALIDKKFCETGIEHDIIRIESQSGVHEPYHVYSKLLNQQYKETGVPPTLEDYNGAYCRTNKLDWTNEGNHLLYSCPKCRIAYIGLTEKGTESKFKNVEIIEEDERLNEFLKNSSEKVTIGVNLSALKTGRFGPDAQLRRHGYMNNGIELKEAVEMVEKIKAG